MSLSDFHSLTVFELMEALEAKQRFERDKWEQTRMVMYAMLLPHQSKGGLKPKDVLSLPWDTIKKEELTPEEAAEREAKRKERFARWDAEAKLKANGRV